MIQTGELPPLRQIVVVNSRAEARARLRSLLRSAGMAYDIAEADSAAFAVHTIRNAGFAIDCLLLDDDLPDSSVLEVIASLVTADGATACPIVVLSQRSSPTSSRAALRAGAQDVVDMDGLTASVLARTVEHGLERWKLAKQRRRTERRLAIEHAVSRILGAATQLADVLPTVLATICRGLEMDAGVLWLLDGSGHLSCAAPFIRETVPDGNGFAHATSSLRLAPGDGLPGLARTSRAAAWFETTPTVAEDPRRSAAIAAGLTSAVAVPVEGKGEFVGVLELFSRGRLPRDPAMLAMLGALAGELAQFILRETAERALRANDAEEAERRMLLIDVARRILESSDDEGPLSREIFEMIRGPLDADALFNFRLAGDHLELVASAGVPDAMRASIDRIPFNAGLCGRAISLRGPVLANEDEIASDPEGAMLRALGLRAYAGFPLVVASGRVLGSFAIASRRSKLSLDDQQLVQTISHFVALAWERRSVARSLAESEAHLRQTLSATTTGLWAWNIATEAVSWSAECVDVFGFDERTFGGTTREFFELVHPLDRDRIAAVVRGAVATNTRFECEVRMVTPKGLIWVENRGRATYDANGVAVAVVGTVTDITARKRAELRALSREHELQLVTDAVPDIITRFDRELRHVFISPAIEPVTGRSCSEFIGKTNREMGMPEELCALWDSAMRKVFETGEALSFEFAFPAVDGVRHFESRLVLKPGTADEGPCVIGVTRDQTARKASDQRLAEALRIAETAVQKREQLVSVVSHDLRNPLGIVSIAITTLEKLQRSTTINPEWLAATIERIGRQTRHMSKMLDELMDVASVTAGSSLVLHPEPIDLVELARAAIDEQRLLASRSIEVDVLAPEVVGMWDRQRLSRVVNNLVSNAIKYSPQGEPVRVQIGLTDGWAALDVIDQGIGIPREEQARVFDWFARGTNAVSSAIPGTGIGLAGARQIVEQHGGTISVTSEPGRGSKFSVRLPL